MASDEKIQAAKKVIQDKFGSRLAFVFNQLDFVATHKVKCDITLLSSAPHIDVTVNPDFSYAMMYGAGAQKMSEMLSMIKLSDGSTISIKEIWTINQMPQKGFTTEELSEVDISAGDQVAGQQGETVREMIAATYRCTTDEEVDHYLRRFLAS